MAPVSPSVPIRCVVDVNSPSQGPEVCVGGGGGDSIHGDDDHMTTDIQRGIFHTMHYFTKQSVLEVSQNLSLSFDLSQILSQSHCSDH